MCLQLPMLWASISAPGQKVRQADLSNFLAVSARPIGHKACMNYKTNMHALMSMPQGPQLAWWCFLLISLMGLTSLSSASAQQSTETLHKLETLDKRAPPPNYPPGIGPVTLLSPAGLLLATFDKNQDYTISQAEFNAAQALTFAAADKNKDKSLSLFELEDWRAAALGSHDAQPGNLGFDPDFNHIISPAEFSAELQRLFDDNDKNKDGQLGFSELVQIVERQPRQARPDSRLEQDYRNRPGTTNQRR